ncbi:hypothetical protein HK105_207267 [Polyrhizophydium stewartii]|uniref:Uncharacterized protein n=1 Tax=Polyrhizophydium stewartii TaxID=2732419 RepID=A0ABR4N171_9FUNG
MALALGVLALPPRSESLSPPPTPQNKTAATAALPARPARLPLKAIAARAVRRAVSSGAKAQPPTAAASLAGGGGDGASSDSDDSLGICSVSSLAGGCAGGDVASAGGDASAVPTASGTPLSPRSTSTQWEAYSAMQRAPYRRPPPGQRLPAAAADLSALALQQLQRRRRRARSLDGADPYLRAALGGHHPAHAGHLASAHAAAAAAAASSSHHNLGRPCAPHHALAALRGRSAIDLRAAPVHRSGRPLVHDDADADADADSDSDAESLAAESLAAHDGRPDGSLERGRSYCASPSDEVIARVAQWDAGVASAWTAGAGGVADYDDAAAVAAVLELPAEPVDPHRASLQAFSIVTPLLDGESDVGYEALRSARIAELAKDASGRTRILGRKKAFGPGTAAGVVKVALGGPATEDDSDGDGDGDDLDGRRLRRRRPSREGAELEGDVAAGAALIADPMDTHTRGSAANLLVNAASVSAPAFAFASASAPAPAPASVAPVGDGVAGGPAGGAAAVAREPILQRMSRALQIQSLLDLQIATLEKLCEMHGNQIVNDWVVPEQIIGPAKDSTAAGPATVAAEGGDAGGEDAQSRRALRLRASKMELSTFTLVLLEGAPARYPLHVAALLCRDGGSAQLLSHIRTLVRQYRAIDMASPEAVAEAAQMAEARAAQGMPGVDPTAFADAAWRQRRTLAMFSVWSRCGEFCRPVRRHPVPPASASHGQARSGDAAAAVAAAVASAASGDGSSTRTRFDHSPDYPHATAAAAPPPLSPPLPAQQAHDAPAVRAFPPFEFEDPVVAAANEPALDLNFKTAIDVAILAHNEPAFDILADMAKDEHEFAVASTLSGQP